MTVQSLNTYLTERPKLQEALSSRGEERRSRILIAATDCFLKFGFGVTSIDAIVARSGGSKATLYRYFPTKEDLFRAVVDSIVGNGPIPLLNDQIPVRDALLDFAQKRMVVVLSAHHQALLRLIAGEAERFPDIAKLYYERGPQKSQDNLSGYLRLLKRRYSLKTLAPSHAAQSFIGMLLHHGYVRQLYLPVNPPSTRQIRRQARNTVDQFMLTYLSAIPSQQR